jgi:hypothetical protein
MRMPAWVLYAFWGLGAYLFSQLALLVSNWSELISEKARCFRLNNDKVEAENVHMREKIEARLKAQAEPQAEIFVDLRNSRNAN